MNKKPLLQRLFPPADWARNMNASTLTADLIAGLTTGVMIIPQSMAYAAIAGLPPIAGLYASTVPLVLYALLGTSRQLSVGPVAMASLVVAGGLATMFPDGSPTHGELMAAAAVITLLAGVVQILLSVLRLGGLVNLLSHPVVSGFTAAAALVIATTQVPGFLGIEKPAGSFLAKWAAMLPNLGSANLVTIGVGLLTIAVILGVKKYNKKLPAAMIAVVIGIALAYFANLGAYGVTLVGKIPPGLPTFSTPTIDAGMIQAALPTAIVAALISFMESISAAKIYARQNKYEISPSQELIALAAAQIGTSMFGGYVVGGALSRTAVNASAGAKTPLANLVTAATVAVALLFLTPIIFYLPTAVLAGIILVAVTNLIDIKEFIHLWKVKRDDLVLLAITFFATLFISVELGILIGVIASLLWLIYCSARPQISVLGLIPDSQSFRCVEHFDEVETFDRVLILRMDAQFFFANVAYLKEVLYQRLAEMPNAVAVVLDASSMNALDSTAADTYVEIIDELRGRNVEIFISHVKGSVLKVMRDTEILDHLGEGHIFYETHDAVHAALRHRNAVDAGLSHEEEKFLPSDMVD